MNKIFIGIIIILFINASFVSSIGGYSEEASQVDIEDVCELKENVLVTCRTFGFPGEPSQESTMSLTDAESLYDKIKELQIEVARDPLSDKTQQLQHEIITLADEHGLLPAGLSAKTLQSRLISSCRLQHPRITLPRLQNKASEMFCNYVSTGSGTSLPIIILPRLIPILLTPIPRLFVRWKTTEGITSCGGLRSGTGFIAYGAQNGIALGFWGIGFSIFLPPVMAYGLFGYALFASVNAEEIELWPPNRAPEISSENPPSGTWDIPASLSELSFRIEDADGDRMSYTVTTEPDIGSGSGNNKKDGVYTVPISGLEHDKIYRWTVEITDGKETVEQQFSFFTEAKPPFDPFDEGWHYRKKISIDHTKVAGDLTNFPVLISTVDSDLRDNAQDDGDDILFMDGAGVAEKLYHEIEQYDGSTGELVAWVNIPSVSDDEDTVFYLYYGNSGCSSQQVPERVWDSNYVTVHHMKDKLSSSIEDSTRNDNDGIKKEENEPIETTGKIGNAQNFDGIDDKIDVSDDATLDITEKITIEAWIRPDVVLNGDFEVTGKTYAYYFELNRHNANNKKMALWHKGSHTWYEGDSSVEAEIWTYVALSWDRSGSGSGTFYFNGEPDYSFSDTVAFDVSDYPLGIGILSGINIRYFDGTIDEVRISNKARSAEWILTQYDNQNDPPGFLSFGPEETGP